MKIAIIGSCRFYIERNIIQQYLQSAGHQVLSTAYNFNSPTCLENKFAYEAVDLANVRDADIVVLVETAFEEVWDADKSYIGEHTWRCIEQAQVLGKQILTIRQVEQALTVGSPFYTFPQKPERAEYFQQLQTKWLEHFPQRPEPTIGPAVDPTANSAEPS